MGVPATENLAPPSVLPRRLIRFPARAVDPPAPTRTRVATVSGRTAVGCRPPTAPDQFVHALARARAAGDRDREAHCLRALSTLAIDGGDPDGAVGLADQALRVCRRQRDRPGCAWTLVHLAEACYAAGNLMAAQARLTEAAALFEHLGITSGLLEALLSSAAVQRRRRQPGEALRSCRHAAVIAAAQPPGAGGVMLLLAVAALSADQAAVDPRTAAGAAELFGAADAWQQRHGGWESVIAAPPATERAATRALLGERAWTAAYGLGRQHDDQRAMARVRAGLAELGHLRPDALRERLTGREADVVGALAEGLSNAEIAARLVISPRTVHAHLRSVFRKLGVRSRTAALREAVRLGLSS